MEAIALSLLSGFGFGSAAILARVGMQGMSPLSSTLLSVVVSFCPTLLLALVFALSDIKDLPPVALAWFFLLGVVNFLGGRTSSYQAIGRIGASRTSAVQSTAAVFASIFAITITGERPHFVVLLGTLTVVLGLTAALGNSIRDGVANNRGMLIGFGLALVAAASYGGTNVIAKELTEEYGSPLMVSAFGLLFGVILLWPLAGRSTIREVRESRGNMTFVLSAGFSGLAAATGVIALYFALQRADVTVVSPIVSTNPIFTLILAQIFISRMENLTKWLFLGVGITVAGVIVVTVGSTL
jgi:drug/metabolite transporter (DMT)-like permease|tara:strand:+ start:468 stop:1361 length:894 start_codon:yes stop_codon:yes gene_type:complete